jgi:glutathione-independent formaldehyde dehydrogenase
VVTPIKDFSSPRQAHAKVINPDTAPEDYAAFDSGVAHKFVIDPHGSVARR